ncbi:MAG: undecaprenyldiphospho-muramoylpentapeptide beta-N-acetylglucosaminyltransferase [Clostridia bacterium]|nr:undecaprenyldiphospho-muramoylpentapeptide beta-N-acetylglucosaminyltransferase [Clostridia bacterium]MBQ7788089.1 undecaprenyldiphospho-muramoylpentapeptide beta-N-acetylglucosaminyltransferase [Clostridia bacterium]
MRVLFCGGGTAGHVNPAIAIAQTIMRNSSDSKVAYVATMNGIENSLVDFKKYHIDIRGMKRRISIENVKTLFLLMDAIKKSKQIIKEFHPDIIVGTGGYATYPVIYAGHKLGVKTVIHESNALPGKATKMLQKKVDKIFTNFKQSERFFKDKNKIINTGNPLRYGFETYDKQKTKLKLNVNEKYVVVCYGGSLGARRINESAIDIIDNFIRYSPNVRFIWSSGKRDYYDMKKILVEKRFDKLSNVELHDYIYNMPEIMAMADIVISRAGAMSISELAASGKCAILIPSPNVADNHQYENARVLEENGAAMLITEDRIYTITDVVRDLVSDDAMRLSMEKEISKFHKASANKIIYQEINNLISRR